MEYDREKLIKAKSIIEKIANGINPISGESIKEDSFMQDPRLIRCFFYIADVLDAVIKNGFNGVSAKPTQFVITPEQKKRIKLPDYNIGVNEFAKCVNNVIDPSVSKRLTGADINRQLKKMGILSEIKLPDGKTKTVMNENSQKYGIEVEKRTYKDIEYEVIVFNEKGKKFLLENLEKIMSY
ncbi:hypothetical protein [Caldicellulosiruptor acetigenus]|uniref:hypothetical protein n=1 Tax=Caldicellulosiruptor acetigenus TaxID=301953 RepID=UPI0004238AB1|nr:hypothetical protein [Caldicellulosiruptor acetigenus]WAM36266.1 hypothetical protein OTK01_000019 [Caldicellulosiruptor acetigenus]